MTSDRGHRRYQIAVGPPPTATRGPARESRRPPRWVLAGSCAYAAGLLALLAMARWSAPEWWPIHLLLYGPRWAMALPWPLLAIAAAWCRSTRAVPVLVLAALALVPTWGVVLPRPWRAPAGDPDVPSLRVMTCNIQGGDVRVDALAGLIRRDAADFVLLQECQLRDPRKSLGLDGWDFRSEGEFCILSRVPIGASSVLRRPDKAYRAFAFKAKVSWGGVPLTLVSAHLMTPRKGLEAVIRSPLGGGRAFREVTRVQDYESRLLREWTSEVAGPILLAGDFNLTSEHPLYRRDWSGYADAFAYASWGLGHTMFTRMIGLRIDHILAGPGWRADRCRVGPDIGSAHRPVIADLSRVEGPPG